jgi:hypothetical protein
MNELVCAVCGGTTFSDRAVIWDALAEGLPITRLAGMPTAHPGRGCGVAVEAARSSTAGVAGRCPSHHVLVPL